MSPLTSAMLQYPCKTTVQNSVGPEVNDLQVRGARCLVFKFMDLFDTALQVHGPMVYLTHYLICVVFPLTHSICVSMCTSGSVLIRLVFV
jgi:hypothetical protein